MNDPRDEKRTAPHMTMLAAFVDELRFRGLEVPDFDPNNAGTNAKAVFLLESPGPKAVGTRYISLDNPDPSARNMRTLLREAGFRPDDFTLWNVVPYCVSTADKNRNATTAQIRESLPDTQNFIDLFQNLRVVVLCGRRAQRVERMLALPEGIDLLKTFHPGARSYNKMRNRLDMAAVFERAARLIGRH